MLAIILANGLMNLFLLLQFQTTAPKSCYMRPPGGILAPGESIIATGIVLVLRLFEFHFVVGISGWTLIVNIYWNCLAFIIYLNFLSLIRVDSVQVCGAY